MKMLERIIQSRDKNPFTPLARYMPHFIVSQMIVISLLRTVIGGIGDTQELFAWILFLGHVSVAISLTLWLLFFIGFILWGITMTRQKGEVNLWRSFTAYFTVRERLVVATLMGLPIILAIHLIYDYSHWFVVFDASCLLFLLFYALRQEPVA